jgi:Tol biopolymer transport system component
MRMYPILLLVVGLALSACGDPGGPPPEQPMVATGAQVSVTTTGLDIDGDGYHITVDGSNREAIAANGAIVVALDPGRRMISLTGLTPNCALGDPGLRTVTIVAGEMARVEFAVACTATSGVVGVVASTSGFVAGVLYQANVDGTVPFPVTPGAPAYLAGVSAGNHVVSLGAPANCSVKTKPQSVTLTAGTLTRDTVEVTFSVTCVGPSKPRIAFVRRANPDPDGRPGPPDIYIANADGSQATWLTSGEKPAWSPDGRRIAFHRGAIGATIYVIDVDGSNERPLQRGGNPAWSPDGTRIVFNTTVVQGGSLFVMNADGSGFTQLIRGDFAKPGSDDWLGFPEWSPDGQRISFVREPDYDSYEPWRVYVMNADGSAPHPLEDPRSACDRCTFQFEHAWSPDGSRIASAVMEFSETGEFWEIASVKSSGADFRIHYRDELGGYAAHPDWSPDGRSLVFEKYVTTSGCTKPGCPKRIFVVSVDGGSARQLIPEDAQRPDYWDDQPAWSRAKD